MNPTNLILGRGKLSPARHAIVRRLTWVSLPILALVAGSALAEGWGKTETTAFEVDPSAVHIGALADSRILHVVVCLRLRNQKQLDEAANDLDLPGGSMFSKHLSHPQVVEMFDPTESDAGAVVTYLRNSGFTGIQVSPSRHLISGDASVASLHTAFNTSIEEFSYRGHREFANVSDARVPQPLSSIVLAVEGLSSFNAVHTMIAYPMATAPSTASSGFDPAALHRAYGAFAAPTGSGIVIGTVTEGALAPVKTDLATFESTNGIAPTQVIVEGARGSNSSNIDEWDLDSQGIVGMSGGVGTLILYNASALTDAALTVDYDLAYSEDKATAINISLGECERIARNSGAMAADDQIFEEAAVQMQTFIVASGNRNDSECGFPGSSRIKGDSYPASSPFVVAVGGTSLKLRSDGTYSGETAWQASAAEGTGGGPSLAELQPGWQGNVLGITGSRRGVPDIAMDADPQTGAIIVVNGIKTQVGGTGLAASLFTGVLARTRAIVSPFFGGALIYQEMTPVGNEHQYMTAYSPAYHDVTSGNNGGEVARRGWNYCTGVGSPKVDVFMALATSFSSY